MIEMLRKNAMKAAIALAVLLTVAGLFFRADSGPESIPLMYPVVGIVAVVVVVIAVRLLVPALKTGEGGDDAD